MELPQSYGYERLTERFCLFVCFLMKASCKLLVMNSVVSKAYFISPALSTGTAEPGGLGGFSPPTFEEDDILFCFSIYSYSRKYIRVFAR